MPILERVVYRCLLYFWLTVCVLIVACPVGHPADEGDALCGLVL